MASSLVWLLKGKGHGTGVHGRALRDFTFAGTGIRLYGGNLVSVLLKRLRKERNSSEKNKRNYQKKKKKDKSWPNPFSYCRVTILLDYNLGTFLGMRSIAYGKALKSMVKDLVSVF